MATNNKEIARRVFEEIWNKHNVDAADEFISADFVQHDPQTPSTPPGIEGYKQTVRYYLNAFPDTHFTIDDQVSEGQTVVTRWTVNSTHAGNLGSIPPTGRRVSISGVTIGRIANGKFVEGWSTWDTLGLMRQLGVVPPAETQRAA